MRILVALGGNALQPAGGHGSWAEATEQMRATAPALARLVRDGHELLLTHGNGPQVGALLRQNELAEREIPSRPMHVLGAETQGQIGYLIQQELTSALERAKVPRLVVTLISRIEVAGRDPAFRHPTKPVGRYYSDAEARILKKNEGWELVFDGARGGWRRVVPSPVPVRWVESEAVRHLVRAGWGDRWVPIVAGGGGIPVVARGHGVYVGVDAVIDKDLTAALVATELGVEVLAIVTDVTAIATGFGKPWERWLGEISRAELKELLDRGEFGEGSMAPKVSAGLSFLANGGRRFVVTDIPSLSRALRGEAGTRVVRA
ncbi:MAG: carbamate kinase [Thermoplasmata archaeon]|nr:carbamate kinase [Thermoplasmata archaeon]